ncbi:MAG: hypothetical protein IH851_11130, partial [Armatimonadetes bacterium]|nr:hypothetical protein [Armatimonadota bacterium]
LTKAKEIKKLLLEKSKKLKEEENAQLAGQIAQLANEIDELVQKKLDEFMQSDSTYSIQRLAIKNLIKRLKNKASDNYKEAAILARTLLKNKQFSKLLSGLKEEVSKALKPVETSSLRPERGFDPFAEFRD